MNNAMDGVSQLAMAMANGWGVTMATFPPDWLRHNQSVSWFSLQGNNAMIKDGILGNAHR